MKNILSLLFVFTFLSSNAQYTTPGTGVIWTFDSLVVHSNGTVISNSDNNFQIDNALTIAETDFITGIGVESILIESSVLVTISGSLIIDNSDTTLISVAAADAYYSGFRFESSSAGLFRKVNFEYGGGFKVLTSTFTIDSCIIREFNNISTTGAAIEVSTGQPIISNSLFINNISAGISSAANASVAPIISNNLFQGNNTSNSNRPQINMGPSGSAGTTIITENTIMGNPDHDQVGGIAFSSLFGTESTVLIENNHVEDNRYGIAVIGNGITATVRGNTCINNNTQDDPLLGGSGLNFNASASTSSAIVANNTITGNHWGITIQGVFGINMGDGSIESPGHNSFDENGNSDELFALYNNSPNPVSALDNCWISSQSYTLAEAEDVIFHQVDDISLGLVSFDPMWNCNLWLAIEETHLENELLLYPNPTTTDVTIEFSGSIDLLKVYSLSGKLIYTQNYKLESPISLTTSSLTPGVYFVELSGDDGVERIKFVKR